MGNILTVGEIKSGELRKVSLEAASLANTLAKELGGEAHAILIGENALSLGELYKDAGVTKVTASECGSVTRYIPNAYADTIAALVNEGEYDAILFPTTIMGRDLSALVGAILGSPSVTDCVEAKVDGGSIVVKRPAFAGKVFTTLKLTGKPAIFGIRPNVFPVEAKGTSAAVVKLPCKKDNAKIEVTAQNLSEGDEIPVTEADIIISGGRTAKGAEIFDAIRPIAKLVNGAVGASRAAVDAGFIDHSHQVGQTGATVSPSLYVAASISGAIQHLAGMASSKVIVAINKDPEAPMVKVADYAVIADVYEFLPAFEAELKKVLG